MRSPLRTTLIVVAALAVLAALAGWLLVGTRGGQDWLMARLASQLLAAQSPADVDGLRVFLCGTASPLGAPGDAQSCVAVSAGSGAGELSLFVVDAGMGSIDPLQAAGERLDRLQALLVTHFHSDHITGIADLNLNSWVRGRAQPLRVVGPAGVERVVAGLNEAFALDRGYRTAHHGNEMLPEALGAMVAETIEPGVIHDADGLTITAFAVDHRPVAPAFGYRFDYRGRSVVISGDTVVTDSLRAAAKDADLLLHDVLSTRIVQGLEKAMADAGRPRQAKIMQDIQSYHAAAADLGALAQDANVRMLAVYHFVPSPRNFLMRRMYEADLPDGTVLTEDGMAFELPPGSTQVRVLPP